MSLICKFGLVNLPFKIRCRIKLESSVFTSKDNFHVDIVPLFLRPDQTFVEGIKLKEDLKKLVERYLALDKEEFDKGMDHYAKYPPDDTSFTTPLWDKHTPKWRNTPAPVNKQLQDALMQAVKKMDESEEVWPHNLASTSEPGYVKMERKSTFGVENGIVIPRRWNRASSTAKRTRLDKLHEN